MPKLIDLRFAKRAAVGVMIGLLGGCAGSETGNGARPRDRRPVSMALQLGTGAAAIALFDEDRAPIVLDGARLSISRVDLALPEGEACAGLPGSTPAYVAACDGERVRVDGPWVVDVLGGGFSPPFEAIEVLTGEVASIDMRLSPGAVGGGVIAGDALDGASVDLVGSIVVGGVERRLGLTLDVDKFVHFRGDDGLVIGDATDTLALSLDAGAWFSDLPLARCIADGAVPAVGGVLRLELADKRACGDVAKAIERALTVPGRAVARGH